MNFSNLRDLATRIKFHFDIGNSFLSLVSFCLLVLAASDKIQTVWNISALKIGIILIPIAFLLTYLFGLFLDSVIQYQKSYTKLLSDKNPQIMEILERVKRIEDITCQKQEKVK